MAQRLTAAFCNKATKPGKYGDGNGLYLRVTASGSKQWIQRITVRGKRVDMGLGGFPIVSLAEARQAAFDNRKLARAGGDPVALRNAGAAPTFRDAMEAVIQLHKPTWKNGGKSEAQWRASLNEYAVPMIGRLRVDEVTPQDVMRVLLPIWNEKRETARRVRQRIGAVMKWAVAQGHRQDNPAGDAIGAALPKNGANVTHQKALPHAEVAEAIAAVRQSNAGETTKLAFEFLVLTACRSGEVRCAKWAEVDSEQAIWTVPASRMKAGLEHRVPLPMRAMAVLDAARELSDGTGLVFPSPNGKPLSDNTLSKLLRDLDVSAVPHGFRSSFRDWAGERSRAPREVAEAALAHTIKNKAEAAYARSDLFEKRRDLMESWARYLNPTAAAKVVAIR